MRLFDQQCLSVRSGLLCCAALWCAVLRYALCVALQVATEHAILVQLAQQQLSFKVPTALPALKTGEPYVVLSSGAAACVFEIIPGEAGPGRKAGRLATSN